MNKQETLDRLNTHLNKIQNMPDDDATFLNRVEVETRLVHAILELTKVVNNEIAFKHLMDRVKL